MSNIHHTSEKKIFTRSSKIPKAYIGYEVIIHRGNKFKTKNINSWVVGFKFGEFTWNRKIALYKSKQKKKKK